MHQRQNRRHFLQSFAFTSAALTAPGAFAEQLTRTPRQTEGPFYPDHLPLDTDNDLLIVNDNITPAVGQVTHLSGQVLSTRGEPIRNAVVEIWQVDRNGSYIHTDSARRGGYDTNFQGFGRFLTNAKGEYYFRTIKPVAYGPRTPHIHFAVKRGNRRMLTTQCYVKGDPQNNSDTILSQIREKHIRESVIVDFMPISEQRSSELKARFDLMLGLTPDA
ncbi:MAG: protocatechuate 3,4-dioxygenase [Pirellulales bacterium]|nr:protocatechuate 3,4-dioxygenase [Pirellulales bacterium]